MVGALLFRLFDQTTTKTHTHSHTIVGKFSDVVTSLLRDSPFASKYDGLTQTLYHRDTRATTTTNIRHMPRSIAGHRSPHFKHLYILYILVSRGTVFYYHTCRSGIRVYIATLNAKRAFFSVATVQIARKIQNVRTVNVRRQLEREILRENMRAIVFVLCVCIFVYIYIVYVLLLFGQARGLQWERRSGQEAGKISCT